MGRNRRRGPITKGSAFTLVELIMVIVVLAILAVAVAISSGSNKLFGVAKKLMFDLRYAQQLAISRQVSCGVSFNPSDNSYFAFIGTTSTIATDPLTRGELSVDYDTDSEYRGIGLDSTDFGDFGNIVSFDYLGAPYNSSGTALSSQGIVTLREGSYTQEITIEPGTGEVKMP